MRWAFEIVALAMIIAGIAALMGRPFWTTRTDGHLVGTYAIQSGTAFRTVSLELDPSLNPLRFNVIGRADRGTHVQGSTPDKSRFDYRITLTQGRETIAQLGSHIAFESKETKPGLTVSVGWRDEPVRGFVSERVSVPRAGRYDISVSAAGSSGRGHAAPRGLELNVYRNEHPTSKNVMWGGIALIVLGVLLAWMAAPVRTETA